MKECVSDKTWQVHSNSMNESDNLHCINTSSLTNNHVLKIHIGCVQEEIEKGSNGIIIKFLKVMAIIHKNKRAIKTTTSEKGFGMNESIENQTEEIIFLISLLIHIK